MKKIVVGLLLIFFLAIISSSVLAQYYDKSVPLYVCKDSKRNETFYSTDSSCPSSSGSSYTGVEGLLGYVLDPTLTGPSLPGGAIALYHCREEGVVDDYFVNTSCGTFTSLGRIGYLLPSASAEIPAQLSYCTVGGDTILITDDQDELCGGSAITVLGNIHRSQPINCDGGLKLYDGWKYTADQDCVINTPQTIKVYNNLHKGFRYAEYYAKSFEINEDITFQHVVGTPTTGASGGAGGLHESGGGGGDGGAGGRGGARPSECGLKGGDGTGYHGADGGAGGRGGGSIALIAGDIINNKYIIVSGGSGSGGDNGAKEYYGRGGGGGGGGGAAGNLFLAVVNYTEGTSSMIFSKGGNGGRGGNGGEESGGWDDDGGAGGGAGGGSGGHVITFPWSMVYPSLLTVNANVDEGAGGSGGTAEPGAGWGSSGSDGDVGQITTDTLWYPENTFYLCSDGIDNDMDGDLDYEDVDCQNTCGAGWIDLGIMPLPPAMNWDFDPSSPSAYDGCCGDDGTLDEDGVVLNVVDDNLAICRGKFPTTTASTTDGYLWEEDEDLDMEWRYKSIAQSNQIYFLPYINREVINLADPLLGSNVRGWYFCGDHPNFKDPSLQTEFKVLNNAFLCMGEGQGSIVECCETGCLVQTEFADGVNKRAYGELVYQGPQNGDFDSKLVIEQDLGVKSFEMPIYWIIISNPGAVGQIEVKRDDFSGENWLMLKNTQTTPLVIESDFFEFANGTAVVRFNTTSITPPYGNFSMQYEVNVTYYDNNYDYLDHKQILIDNRSYYPQGKEVRVTVANDDAVYAKVQISVIDSGLTVVDPASELYIDFIGVGSPYYCAPDGAATKWITDLDEDQQACVASGFTWTGEQCCGDDGLEYYNDTLASCWEGAAFSAGTLLVDPQVPVDRKDILVDEFFYGCELSTPLSKISTVDLVTELVYNVSYCAVNTTGTGHFCNFSGEWSDEPALDDIGDFIGHDTQIGEGAGSRSQGKMAPPPSPSVGCCPVDYCWTGTTCVEDQTDEPWQSGEGGYRCVDPGTGLGWYLEINKTAQDKQTEGYCIDQSQCLGIPFGGTRYNMTCVNDGGVFEEFYCQNGNWTTRTKFLAAMLLNYTLDEAPDNFTLYCDRYNQAFNKFIDTAPADGYKAASGSVVPIHSVVQEFVSDVCVLQMDDEVIFGAVLTKDLDVPITIPGHTQQHSFLDTLTGTSLSSCSSISPLDKYESCVGSQVWYNNFTKTVIYAKNGIDISQRTFMQTVLNYILHPIQTIFGLIGTLLNPRTPSGTLLSFNVLSVGDLNKLYVAEKEGKSVIGVYETQLGGQPIIALDFVDFHSDICSTIRVLADDPYGTGDKVSCQPVINSTTTSISYKVISAASQEIYFDQLWYGLTKQLRITSKSVGPPVAQIVSPLDDSAYLSNDLITLLANKTNTTQSYYWDIDPVGDVLTGELAGYEVIGNAPLILGADTSYPLPEGLVRYGQHNLTLIAIGFDGSLAYDSILFNVSSAYGCRNMLGDMNGDGVWNLTDWYLAKCFDVDDPYDECGDPYPILPNDWGVLPPGAGHYQVCFDINQNEELDMDDDDLFVALCGQPCDYDLDGIADPDDNCPYDYNPEQEDSDYDGMGDVCDPTPGGLIIA